MSNDKNARRLMTWVDVMEDVDRENEQIRRRNRRLIFAVWAVLLCNLINIGFCVAFVIRWLLGR